jgi:hypothetical protein
MMKVTGTEDNSEAKPLAKSRGTLTVKWAGSRDKIFSPSGRGRTFFLTFLFIERFDRRTGILSAIANGITFDKYNGNSATFLHYSRNALVLKYPNYDAAVRGLAICRFVLLYLASLAHCSWG